MFRKENGVTLVALVITIIVLLILAGVTISMVLGDEGIMTNSTQAAKDSELANIKSSMNLAALTVRTDAEAKKAGSTATTILYDEFNTTHLKTAFDKLDTGYTMGAPVTTGEGTSAVTTVTIEGKYWKVPFTIGKGYVTAGTVEAK